MAPRVIVVEVLALVLCPTLCGALNNGLARVPWMGWSAWEVFRGDKGDPEHTLSDTLVRGTADALVAGGFAAAGYNIVWVDDAWASKNRSGTGTVDGNFSYYFDPHSDQRPLAPLVPIDTLYVAYPDPRGVFSLLPVVVS